MEQSFFYWIGLLPNMVGTPCLVTNCRRSMGLIQSKKKHLNCLRPFVYLVTGNSTKKILCILVFTHQSVYGKESLVPTHILKMFEWLDNEVVIDHLKRHFKPTCPLSFYHLYSINNDMTVHYTKLRPIQFKFGKVNDMLTFYDKQGDGWTNIHIMKYFKQKKQMMPVEVYNKWLHLNNLRRSILLETMQEIKVEKISNEYKFSIKCLLENFQANNSTLRARHWKMFKKDTYEFEPIKELVLTMHFGFIESLKKVGVIFTRHG